MNHQEVPRTWASVDSASLSCPHVLLASPVYFYCHCLVHYLSPGILQESSNCCPGTRLQWVQLWSCCLSAQQLPRKPSAWHSKLSLVNLDLLFSYFQKILKWVFCLPSMLFGVDLFKKHSLKLLLLWSPHTNCDSSLQPTAFTCILPFLLLQTHCSSNSLQSDILIPLDSSEHIVATWLVELSRGNVVQSQIVSAQS